MYFSPCSKNDFSLAQVARQTRRVLTFTNGDGNYWSPRILCFPLDDGTLERFRLFKTSLDHTEVIAPLVEISIIKSVFRCEQRLKKRKVSIIAPLSNLVCKTDLGHGDDHIHTTLFPFSTFISTSHTPTPSHEYFCWFLIPHRPIDFLWVKFRWGDGR